jgi:hypothetical protein
LTPCRTPDRLRLRLRRDFLWSRLRLS